MTTISKLEAGKAPRRGGKDQLPLPGLGKFKRTCPECSQRFTTDNPDRMFCDDAHKSAFHNRSSKIGRSLVPLAQAWRLGRNAKGKTPEAEALRKTAAQAFAQMCALIDLANSEDLAEGRQSKLAYVAKRARKTGNVTQAIDAHHAAEHRRRQAAKAEAAATIETPIAAPAEAAAAEFRHNGGPVIDDAEFMRRQMAEGFGK